MEAFSENGKSFFFFVCLFELRKINYFLTVALIFFLVHISVSLLVLMTFRSVCSIFNGVSQGSILGPLISIRLGLKSYVDDTKLQISFELRDSAGQCNARPEERSSS